jgi:hypothetical protein
MNNRPRPEIERTRVSVTISGVAWGAVALPVLGTAGKVLSVQLREDASVAGASAGELFLTDGSASGPADAAIFYASGAVALSGSATAASLRDAIPGGVPYKVNAIGDLYACVNVTSGTGNAKFYIDIIAEVWA